MTFDNIESSSSQTDTSSGHCETAFEQASNGKPELVNRQKQQNEELKSGKKSGITDSFGKPVIVENDSTQRLDGAKVFDDTVAGPAGAPGPKGDRQPIGEIKLPQLENERLVDYGNIVSKDLDITVHINPDKGIRYIPLPGGTQVFEETNGSKEVITNGGLSIQYEPDQKMISVKTEDQSIIQLPISSLAGTHLSLLDKESTQITLFGDGKIVVREKDGIRTEFNDVQTVADQRPDVVRYDSNGKELLRVVIDGNQAIFKTAADGSWSQKKDNGTLIYFDKQQDVVKTILPDRTEIAEWGDGRKLIDTPEGIYWLRREPDGMHSLKFLVTDGEISERATLTEPFKHVFKNGLQLGITVDGTVILQDKDGNLSTFNSNRVSHHYGTEGKEIP